MPDTWFHETSLTIDRIQKRVEAIVKENKSLRRVVEDQGKDIRVIRAQQSAIAMGIGKTPHQRSLAADPKLHYKVQEDQTVQDNPLGDNGVAKTSADRGKGTETKTDQVDTNGLLQPFNPNLITPTCQTEQNLYSAEGLPTTVQLHGITGTNVAIEGNTDSIDVRYVQRQLAHCLHKQDEFENVSLPLVLEEARLLVERRIREIRNAHIPTPSTQRGIQDFKSASNPYGIHDRIESVPSSRHEIDAQAKDFACMVIRYLCGSLANINTSMGEIDNLYHKFARHQYNLSNWSEAAVHFDDLPPQKIKPRYPNMTSSSSSSSYHENDATQEKLGGVPNALVTEKHVWPNWPAEWPVFWDGGDPTGLGRDRRGDEL